MDEFKPSVEAKEAAATTKKVTEKKKTYVVEVLQPISISAGREFTITDEDFAEALRKFPMNVKLTEKN